MELKHIYQIVSEDGLAVGVCLTEKTAIELANIINGRFVRTVLFIADGEEFTITNTPTGQ